MQLLHYDLTSKNQRQASVDVYLREIVQENPQPLPIVVICPGGGYRFVSNRESEPLALAFMNQGYHALVLNYTTRDTFAKGIFLEDCLEQVALTFELIHQNAKKWQANTDEIFLLGCSAGGHLAASYSSQWHQFHQEASYQPKGTILCYPVTSFDLGWPKTVDHLGITKEDCLRYDTIAQINSKTAPTYIWHTFADGSVPVVNSLKYCEALYQQRIPFEAHIFENGKHGLALANESSAKSFDAEYLLPEVAQWFEECSAWMKRQRQN